MQSSSIKLEDMVLAISSSESSSLSSAEEGKLAVVATIAVVAAMFVNGLGVAVVAFVALGGCGDG